MRGWRILACGLLLFLVLLMCLHYPAAEARHDPYPSAAELRSNYPAHVGELVYLWGEVLGRNGGLVTIRSNDIRYVLDRSVPDADRGDSVQVYGTLREDHRINAERVVVSDDAALQNLYAVSSLAVVLTLGLFFRSWTVDWQALVFTEREVDRRG